VRQASTVTPTASPRVFLVDEFPDPYAIALNRSTGAVIWKSAPFAPPLNATVLVAAGGASYSSATGYVIACGAH
jgi:hypothetical protein